MKHVIASVLALTLLTPASSFAHPYVPAQVHIGVVAHVGAVLVRCASYLKRRQRC